MEILSQVRKVLRRWKEYFEELLNEEHERELGKEEPEKIRKRLEEGTVERQLVPTTFQWKYGSV